MVHTVVNSQDIHEMLMASVIGHSKETCVLCRTNLTANELYGRLIKKDDIVVHFNCLYLATYCIQNGRDDEGIFGFLPEDIRNTVEEAKLKRCYDCNKGGATIECHSRCCTRRYHLPCGLDANCLHQFTDQFHTYCSNHLPLNLFSAPKPSKGLLKCLICFSKITGSKVQRVPTCCVFPLFGQVMWFHRRCMQKYAYCSGYKLFCPICDKTTQEYRDFLRKRGVFVPDVDTTYKMEEAIRAELVRERCHASVCFCKDGRSYTDNCKTSEWTMRRCSVCGSGIHAACDSEKQTEYMCQNCIETNRDLEMMKAFPHIMTQVERDEMVSRDILKKYEDQIPIGAKDREKQIKELIYEECRQDHLAKERERQCADNANILEEHQSDAKSPRQAQGPPSIITISDSADHDADHLFQKISKQKNTAKKGEGELKCPPDETDNKQTTAIRQRFLINRLFRSIDLLMNMIGNPDNFDHEPCDGCSSLLT